MARFAFVHPNSTGGARKPPGPKKLVKTMALLKATCIKKIGSPCKLLLLLFKDEAGEVHGDVLLAL